MNLLIFNETLDAAGVFATEGYGCQVDKEKQHNLKDKSRTCARVEYLFGFVVNSMNGSFIRTIGITRAKTKIGIIHPVK